MGPAKLVNLEPDATRTYSRYALKVISPSEWANRVITGFPPAFEVGRNSTKTPQGIPYLLLNMDGNPRQNECSRRYVRIKDTEGGLSVDLLAENNTCVVDGKDLRAKGECAVAKLDAVIELRPDWKFRVITSDAR